MRVQLFLLGIFISLSLIQTHQNMIGHRRINLPEKLIIGYASWNQCDESLIRACQEGVNVLIWFATNLSKDPETLKPIITNGPDWNCVAQIIQQISDFDLPVVHLISIGGWNSPHPDTTFTALETFQHWDHWNREIIARPDLGFYGFDGFDWDIEGNDTPSNSNNYFTVQELDLMGEMSQLARTAGYIVSMAPAESYLDPTTNEFSLSLLHPYPEWEASGQVPSFRYHGRNTYAYLLSKYGQTQCLTEDNSTNTTSISSSSSSLSSSSSSSSSTLSTPVEAVRMIDTFDFIMIQWYEGYSHAQYSLQSAPSSSRITLSRYLFDFMKKLQEGWMVHFSSEPSLSHPDSFLSLPPQKVVIGLANGWAGGEDGKFLLLYPDQIQEAYESPLLKGEGGEEGVETCSHISLHPRGFGFWVIKDEGLESHLRPGEPVWMARGLNSFLHVRP